VAFCKKHLCTYIYCNIIHNSHAMEIAKMPTIDEWIKKIWYFYKIEFYSSKSNFVIFW
jgi:hypothetical protein